MSYNRMKIKSLSGIKTITMIGLFWWHSPLKNPSVDLGARMCEVLFVVSGFLVAINHWDMITPVTYESSINYVKKKVLKVWPLHLIAFLIDLTSSIISGIDIFSLKNAIIAIVNLSFLQAWSTDSKVYFSYNGATWFLSALFFCYYMSPVLLAKTKKSVYPGIAFASVLVIRAVPELLNVKLGWNIFPLNYHVSPIIRCLEFYSGIMLVPFYKKMCNYLDSLGNIQKTIFSTLLEFFAISLYIWVIIKKNEVWIRAYYIPFVCFLVIVFAGDYGWISRLLGFKLFILFSSIQLEFFVLHQAVIHFYNRCINVPPIIGKKTSAVILFITCVIMAISYRRLKIEFNRFSKAKPQKG